MPRGKAVVAAGATGFDDRGRRYIDCLGGYAVFNCGRNHPVIRDALGEHVYGHFLEAKRAEWNDFRLHVSQWELDRYLEAF